MEDFEKSLQDKFKDATSNEGIDPNDLWNTIESNIAGDDNPPPTKPSNGFKKYLPIALLLMLTVGGIYIYQYNQTDTPLSNLELSNTDTDREKLVGAKDLDKIDFSENSSTSKTPTNILDVEDQINSQNDIDFNESQYKVTSAEALNTNQQNNQVDQHTRNSSQKTNSNINSSESNNKQVENNITSGRTDKFTSTKNLNTIKDELLNKPKDHTFYNSSESTIEKSKSNSTQFNEILEDKKSKSRLMLENFDQLSSKNFEYPLKESNKSWPSFQPSSVKFDKSQAKFTVGLHGGSHVLWEKFAGDQTREIIRAEELNQAFNLFPGQHFGASLNFHFNQYIFVSTGINFRRSISQFNKTIVTKDSTIIRNDIIAGQMIVADATRTIVHHNKLSTLTIPISIGFQKSFGKWTIGTSAGIAYNLTQKFSGRTQNSNDAIIDYPNTENTLAPTKANFLSYHLDPFVNYKLNRKISIQLRPSIGLYQFGQTALYDLKHTGWSAGLGLGLVYTP